MAKHEPGSPLKWRPIYDFSPVMPLVESGNAETNTQVSSGKLVSAETQEIEPEGGGDSNLRDVNCVSKQEVNGTDWVGLQTQAAKYAAPLVSFVPTAGLLGDPDFETLEKTYERMSARASG